MGFKSNYSQSTQTFDGLKPEGDYECIIVKIEEKTTRNGAKGLNFSMVIRNDVEQGYKNGYIFHTVWRKKNPSTYDEQVKGYNFGQLMAIAEACRLKDDKEYEYLEDFLTELNKKPLRVTLKHDDFNDRTYEKVSFFNPTVYPEVRHKFKEPVSNNTYATNTQSQSFASKSFDIPYEEDEISDEDLPF